MAKHHVLLGAVLVLGLAGGTAPPAAGSSGSTGSRPALVGHLWPAGVVSGPFGPTRAARLQRRLGYLPIHRLAYARAKAGLVPSRSRAGTVPATSTGPVASPSWKGVYDTSVTPGDSTGAVGTARYVELVNLMFGIYSRSGSALATGTLASLVGDPSSALTDPQVLWDRDTNRFYYVVLDASHDRFDVGFSKTASPGSAADWCKYTADFGYGSDLPDYPKLGDTRDFWLIGVNDFSSSGGFVGGDVDWITKPGPGTTCPSSSSFKIGRAAGLLNADGSRTSTPVPVNQTDGTGQGWVVASKDTTGGAGTFVSVFSVTRNPDGSANIQSKATSVAVSSYALPPSAPQPQTTHTFDTLDGRLTQAVSAVDPSRGSVTAVWTQHTVAGGAGSEVRWYEVDPLAHSVLQSGKATSGSLYAFNGAVSPDRAVIGSSGAYGDSMVLGFDTSSAQAFEAIQMVSKVGTGAQSGFVLVRQSAGRNVDFGCTPLCRWGDYMGASPDPVDPGGGHGKVWLTSEYNVSSTSNSNVDWRSQNWGATP